MSISTTSITPIDVEQFFLETVAAYTCFHKKVSNLTKQLPHFTPDEIAIECQNIQDKRDQLSERDEEIFTIVNLAGNEIKSEQFVTDYRKAFTLAIAACDDLHESLQHVKTTLTQ